MVSAYCATQVPFAATFSRWVKSPVDTAAQPSPVLTATYLPLSDSAAGPVAPSRLDRLTIVPCGRAATSSTVLSGCWNSTQPVLDGGIDDVSGASPQPAKPSTVTSRPVKTCRVRTPAGYEAGANAGGRRTGISKSRRDRDEVDRRVEVDRELSELAARSRPARRAGWNIDGREGPGLRRRVPVLSRDVTGRCASW